jgi:hypothetical protein
MQVVEVPVPRRVDGLRYLAGDDGERAEALTAAFRDPSTSAVVCARGGYGCLRLLPHLDPTTLPAEVRCWGTLPLGTWGNKNPETRWEAEMHRAT